MTRGLETEAVARPAADRVRFGVVDVAAVGVVLLLHAAMLVRARAFTAPPAEDAAMLLRYSEHLADGHGIVWNVGEQPLDGATDFLYMVLIAALNSLGVSALAGARALDLLATVAVVLAAYALGRVVFRQSVWVSAIGPALLAVGPAAAYTAMGFSAPFYGAMVAAAALVALYFVRTPTPGAAVGLGLTFLLVGLTRPEGVFLAALLTASILLVRREASRQLVRGLLIGFVAPGLVYFLWRWWYFSQPLPNPFLKKGGGELHIDGLLSAITGGVWLAPLGLLLLLPLLSARHRRSGIALLIPLAGYTLIWVLLSSEMNYLFRFQYPVVVLFALAVPWLWSTRGDAAWVGRLAAPAVLAAAVVVNLAVSAFVSGLLDTVGESRDDVGVALQPFAGEGLLLATSEAGLAPLNSDWRTLDLWGLNDREIARDGLTVELLQRADPAVVLLHEEEGSPLAGWNAMLDTVQEFMAASGDFVEVASWGPETRTFHVYVSEQAPAELSDAVCQALSGEPTAHCLA